jgi:hypothetical protein
MTGVAVALAWFGSGIGNTDGILLLTIYGAEQGGRTPRT